MLVLLFVALWFIVQGDLFYVLPCVILFLCVFSPFSIANTSLGEERANLSAFCAFVRFCVCLDLSVSSSSWCLGRAAVCDCGTPLTFLLLFFVMNRLIRISILCHFVTFFLTESLFATMDVSKIRDGRVHVRNSG